MARVVGRPPRVRGLPIVARWGPALVLACVTLGGPASTAAADPSASPGPVVFPQPHYLVFMESHRTMNGPVVDEAFWLYPYLPDGDGTHFAVPDGYGGVFHYTGSVVAGPFANDDEACPEMLARDIPSLMTWATMAGESPLVVDCARFRATPTPAATAASASVAGQDVDTRPSPATRDTSGEETRDQAMAIAAAIILLLLTGGGLTRVVSRRRQGGPSLPATNARPDREPDASTDPCAEQAASVERASLTGRYLNGLLDSARRYDALLQREIDVLANLVLPGSVLLDLGFVAGGLSGAVGPKLLATETFWGALGEAVAKDVAKDVAKQALGGAATAFDPATTAQEGGLSAAKQVLLTAIRDSIVNQRFLGEVSPAGPVKVFPDATAYVTFTREMEGYADAVAGPVADGIGALLDLYNGALDAIVLKDRLDQLRSVRDSILDQVADLELRFEDAVSDQRFAADRLAHCREINAPDWRP